MSRARTAHAIICLSPISLINTTAATAATATSPPSTSSHPHPHVPVPNSTCTATCRSTSVQAAHILYATTTPLISAACRSNFNVELGFFVLLRCSDARTYSLCMTVRVIQTPCHTRGGRRPFCSNHHLVAALAPFVKR